MGAAQSNDPLALTDSAEASRLATDALFDALPIGLIVFDTKLRIRTANVAARSLVENESDATAFLARLCADDVNLDWAGELRNVWQGRVTRRFDAMANDARGNPERYFDVIIRPLSDVSTADAAGVILIDDVTPRITMQRRLTISERMATIGKVAARVAHELNNPLDGILRYASLAKRRLDDGAREKVFEYLDRIREGSLRMSGIVRDLLEFSRSHTDIDREATINGIVADAVEAMRAIATEQQIVLNHEPSSNDARVDRGTGLFQVFCNLIKNAIDAMDRGGALTIRIRTSGHDIVAELDDTGPGVPDVEQIFEAFYTTKEEGRGTGLGLAVCREIVESIGGSIVAENRPDGGARFTVRVPRHESSEAIDQQKSRDNDRAEADGVDGEKLQGEDH